MRTIKRMLSAASSGANKENEGECDDRRGTVRKRRAEPDEQSNSSSSSVAALGEKLEILSTRIKPEFTNEYDSAIQDEEGEEDGEDPSVDAKEKQAGHDEGGEDETEYQVEKLLGKRRVFKDGKTIDEYLVKWLGWERKEDRTWEPYDNLKWVSSHFQKFLKTPEHPRSNSSPARR